ncbi:hypothetical protein D3C87_1333830 [compost metagenome]
MGVAGGGALEQHAAPRGVAFAILVDGVPHGVPGAEVGPAGIQRHHHARHAIGARELLHHRVVDRVRRHRRERRRVRMEHRALAAAGGEGIRAGRVHGRLQLLQRAQPGAGAHHEDAAVPPVLARGHVLGRQFGGRLFHEGVDPARGIVERGAQPDVAKPGIGARRRHAKRDHRALLGKPGRAQHGLLEGAVVGNYMVGRHGHEDAVLALGAGKQRGQGQGRGGVAPGRLHHDARCHAGFGQLLGGHEAVRLATDDDRGHLTHRTAPFHQPGQPARGGLEQRVTANHVDQLLGEVLAREGPEPRARAAGEHHCGQPQAHGGRCYREVRRGFHRVRGTHVCSCPGRCNGRNAFCCSEA